MQQIQLNPRAAALCQQMIAQAVELRIEVLTTASGATILDCGVQALGGIAAGLRLSEVCTAGLSTVGLVPAREGVWEGPAVSLTTDQPVAACMASQYAGWKIAHGKFFAMGSGPMRTLAQQESILEVIGYQQAADTAVGVLETAEIPSDEVCCHIASECKVSPEKLTLLVAPTRSLAGGVQIVARSVETTLHKMSELGFDLNKVVSGHGTAPLPPPAADDLTAIGRTNDAILYGGEVTLWVQGVADEELKTLGRKIPSSASGDHGVPFIELFRRAGGNFYELDPMLFSPALVMISNLDSGNTHRFGHLVPRIIHRSFAP